MTPRLEQWRKEIEALSGAALVLVPVTTDPAANTLSIPPAFPGRPLVRRLLETEAFVVQLLRAHALTVTMNEGGAGFQFVLLNNALRADWNGDPEGLLGHEYGHLWLNASGYRSPAVAGDPCLTTHGGDIVQHILLRDELRRRGFTYDAFWTATQQRWLAQQTGRLAIDRCGRLQLLSAWMDASLGYTAQSWPARDRFLAHLETHYPELQPTAAALQALLDGRTLWDRSLYERALLRVLDLLSSLA
jgi:hypothetical protein